MRASMPLLLKFVLTIASCYTLAAKGQAAKPMYIFQHVGKAGGGTVTEFIQSWNVAMWFKVCYPQPCLTPWMSHNFDGLLINIRDPVDRFVSFFDYRHTVLCDRSTGAHDSRTPRRQWFQGDWDKNCKDIFPEESKVLSGMYHGDANELAESLCIRGPEAKAAAEEHLQHSGTLVKHVGGEYGFNRIISSNQNFSFTVVPLEHGFDFVQLTQSAIRALTADVGGIEYSKILERRAKTVQVNASSSFLNRNAALVSSRPPSKLSAAGECCVAQFYAEDYKIIEQLGEIGCRGPQAKLCKAAVNSIVARRYGQYTSNDCSTLALQQ